MTVDAASFVERMTRLQRECAGIVAAMACRGPVGPLIMSELEPEDGWTLGQSLFPPLPPKTRPEGTE